MLFWSWMIVRKKLDTNEMITGSLPSNIVTARPMIDGIVFHRVLRWRVCANVSHGRALLNCAGPPPLPPHIQDGLLHVPVVPIAQVLGAHGPLAVGEPAVVLVQPGPTDKVIATLPTGKLQPPASSGRAAQRGLAHGLAQVPRTQPGATVLSPGTTRTLGKIPGRTVPLPALGHATAQRHLIRQTERRQVAQHKPRRRQRKAEICGIGIQQFAGDAVAGRTHLEVACDRRRFCGRSTQHRIRRSLGEAPHPVAQGMFLHFRPYIDACQFSTHANAMPEKIRPSSHARVQALLIAGTVVHVVSTVWLIVAAAVWASRGEPIISLALHAPVPVAVAVLAAALLGDAAASHATMPLEIGVWSLLLALHALVLAPIAFFVDLYTAMARQKPHCYGWAAADVVLAVAAAALLLGVVWIRKKTARPQ